MEQSIFIFFAQIEPIKESLNVFEVLKKKEFYFYYFQKNKLYYIFLYGQYGLATSFEKLLPSLVIIKELNTKKRRIRSLRGFILHALEIIQDEKGVTVLKTNFRPRFWNQVPNIIRQNRKNSLIKYAFKSLELDSTLNQDKFTDMEIRIGELQNQISQLKTKLGESPKKLKLDDKVKIIDLEPTNDIEVINAEVYGNLSEQTFVKFNDLHISEKEDIIKTGFKLHHKNSISLKDYYEGTGLQSLHSLKGFSINYQVVRRENIYKRLQTYLMN